MQQEDVSKCKWMSLLGQNMDTLRKDEVEQTTEERKNPEFYKLLL